MEIMPPPDPEAYHSQVWALVRQVPSGKVVTYGQVAQLLPVPEGIAAEDYKVFGPRWVGGAMAVCPPDVPWQRVINAQGKISQRPGAEKQRKLLEMEGIQFVNDKIQLKVYQWGGPGAEGEPRQIRLL